MCAYLEIETVVANALIELFRKKEQRKVTFDTIVRYGQEVGRVYEQNTGNDYVLLFSRQYQSSMQANYSDLFDIEMEATGDGFFTLKDNVIIEDLEYYFRWGLNRKLRAAFVSPEALKVLYEAS